MKIMLPVLPSSNEASGGGPLAAGTGETSAFAALVEREAQGNPEEMSGGVDSVAPDDASPQVSLDAPTAAYSLNESSSVESPVMERVPVEDGSVVQAPTHEAMEGVEPSAASGEQALGVLQNESQRGIASGRQLRGTASAGAAAATKTGIESDVIALDEQSFRQLATQDLGAGVGEASQAGIDSEGPVDLQNQQSTFSAMGRPASAHPSVSTVSSPGEGASSHRGDLNAAVSVEGSVRKMVGGTGGSVGDGFSLAPIEVAAPSGEPGLYKGLEASSKVSPAIARVPVTQIGDVLQRAAQQGLSQLSVTLQPEGLGEVDVQIRVERGWVHIDLRAENLEATGALNANLGSLRERLESQGLSLGGLDVGTRSREGEHSGRRAPAQAQSNKKEENASAQALPSRLKRHGLHVIA